MTLFDIETKPRTDLVRRFIKPFPALDPSAVKYGNTKDPQKRAELLKQKEDDHRAEEVEYWRKAEERAALNPLTAEIICIGMLDDRGEQVFSGSERNILESFWNDFGDFARAGESFVFWSGNGAATENFDVEFIIRRSWMLGVPVHPLAFNGRYLGNRFVDAAARYLFGKREAYCSLSDAADQLGLFTPGCDIFPKSDTDPVQGVNFWEWFEGRMTSHPTTGEAIAPERQRAMALQYLSNDLRLLRSVAGRVLGQEVEAPVLANA